MKLLLLADKESRYLWDFYKPGCLREYDLMLSCGDLKAEYLTFLATLGRSPLLYVRGNHDDNYESRPPEGCECIEDKLVTVGGLRIVGLGGSPLYSGGRNQYTERQMEARIRKLGWKIRTSTFPLSGLYFSITLLFNSSLVRSPSHQAAKFTEAPLFSDSTLPLKSRIPPDAVVHISQPGLVGSMSAAMLRPTSILEGIL